MPLSLYLIFSHFCSQLWLHAGEGVFSVRLPGITEEAQRSGAYFSQLSGSQSYLGFLCRDSHQQLILVLFSSRSFPPPNWLKFISLRVGNDFSIIWHFFPNLIVCSIKLMLLFLSKLPFQEMLSSFKILSLKIEKLCVCVFFF